MNIFKFNMLLAIFCCILVKVSASASTESNIESLTVAANGTIKLLCPTGIKGTTQQWRLLNGDNVGGKLLKADPDFLELSSVKPEDNGIYACFINESLVKKYNVTVSEPPHFIKKMQQIIYKPAGNTLRLQCKVRSSPQSTVKWYKDNQWPIKREFGEVDVRPWTITLENARISDTGSYTCVACNLFHCINFTYLVTVIKRYHAKPYVEEGYPRNLTLLENGTAIFKCPFKSDLHPYIKWFRILNSTDSKQPHNYSGLLLLEGFNGKLLGSGLELKIDNVTLEDEGWYACVLSNSLGTTTSKAYLHVENRENSTEFSL